MVGATCGGCWGSWGLGVVHYFVNRGDGVIGIRGGGLVSE